MSFNSIINELNLWTARWGKSLTIYRDWLDRSFSQETRRKFLWRALLVFVFLSGLLAWKEENAEYLKSQDELSKAREKIASLEAQPRIGEEAKAQIDGLTQANQQLQQKMTDALGEVEKLKSHSAEMQAQDAPRRIKDLKHFISVLSLFSDQKIDVEYIESDRDAEHFLNEICLAVGVSGWTIENTAAVIGQSWNGVIIEVNDLHAAFPAAHTLATLLGQQETAVAIKQRLGPPKPGRFTIRVGYKVQGTKQDG